MSQFGKKSHLPWKFSWLFQESWESPKQKTKSKRIKKTISFSAPQSVTCHRGKLQNSFWRRSTTHQITLSALCGEFSPTFIRLRSLNPFNFYFDPLTPVPPLTGRDEPWALFHFWRHHLWSKLTSSILNFCRRKRSFQWYPIERKIERKIWTEQTFLWLDAAVPL